MKYGVGMARQLEQESRQLKKYSIGDLMEKLEYYKTLNSAFVK